MQPWATAERTAPGEPARTGSRFFAAASPPMWPKATAAADATSASASLSRCVRAVHRLCIAANADGIDDAHQQPALHFAQGLAERFVGGRVGNRLQAILAQEASSLSVKSGASAGTASFVPQMANCLQGMALSCGGAFDWSTAISLCSRSPAAALVVGRSRTAGHRGGCGRKEDEANRNMSSGRHYEVSLIVLLLGTGPFFGERAYFAEKRLTENMDLSPLRGRSRPPRLPHRFGPQPVGFLVAEKLVLLGIVTELAVQEHGDVGGVAGDVRVAGRVGVGPRLARATSRSRGNRGRGRWPDSRRSRPLFFRRATPANSTPACRCRPPRPSPCRLQTAPGTNPAAANRRRG